MEDELERNNSTLFKNEKEETNLLYLYIPYNEKIENCIITHDINLVKEKNGKIEIFKKDTHGLYRFYNK